MKREIRKYKPNDHENVEKAVELIHELVEINPQIEHTLWAAAFNFTVINGYRSCGFYPEEIKGIFESAVDFYAKNGLWND